MIKGSKRLNCIVCPSICSGQGIIYTVPEVYTDKYNIKFMCDECNVSFECVEDLANNIDSKFSLNLLNIKEKKAFILSERLNYNYLVAEGYEVENIDEY